MWGQFRAAGAVAIGEPFVRKGQCPLSSSHRGHVGVSDQVFQVFRISKRHWRLRYLCKSFSFCFFWGGEGALCGTGFPVGASGKESAFNAGHLGLIPGLGRSPGRGHGNPLQYSGLENPSHRQRQRGLEGYSPWGHKELNMT